MQSTASPRVQPRAELEKQRLQRQAGVKQRTRLTPVKIYLLAYNILSAVLWANLLYITLSFLLTPRTGKVSTSYWTRLISSSPLTRKLLGSLPRPLAVAQQHLSGSYGYKNLGWLTKWTQTLAVLEVVHAALGLVRSPIGTTASQVASRVYTVWGVVEAVPKTHSNPLFTTMLLAWSLTEVIRYTYYATSLLGIKLYPLDWLRYTTFLPLYPLGAASEAFISFSTLPPFSSFPVPAAIKSLNPLPHILNYIPPSLRSTIIRTTWGRSLIWNLAKAGAKQKAELGRSWQAVDYARLGLFAVWWPSLFALYTYMLKQRKKVLGAGKTVGTVDKAM